MEEIEHVVKNKNKNEQIIHLAIKLVCLLGLLSGTSLLTQAQPQYVEPEIKIGVFDSEGNPIDKPKVIVYDSLHRFVKEEVVI
ncbi:MAG: hypothetical protein V8R91_13985 [Butyricimonas faecihominis]